MVIFPVSAGLIFGGPAGIIAGTIGAIHRWCAVWWGAGAYTRVACTVGTFLAGVIAALCREVVFNNKKTTWLYGFIIGVTAEVVHMITVFFTHLDDLKMCRTDDLGQCDCSYAVNAGRKQNGKKET